MCAAIAIAMGLVGIVGAMDRIMGLATTPTTDRGSISTSVRATVVIAATMAVIMDTAAANSGLVSAHKEKLP
jgi:hypothetical protein